MKKNRIKELAMELSLMNLAERKFTIQEAGGLELLLKVLEEEVEGRKANAIMRLSKASNLPSLEFDVTRLNEGLQYQVQELLKSEWIDKSKNLFIFGECGKGKTALASMLGNTAISNNLKAFYLSLDELLIVLSTDSRKAMATLNKLKAADLLIIVPRHRKKQCAKFIQTSYVNKPGNKSNAHLKP